MKFPTSREEMLKAFCPTGEGGGIDNSCPPGEGEGRERGGGTFWGRTGRKTGQALADDQHQLQAFQQSGSVAVNPSSPKYKEAKSFYDYLVNRGWARRMPAKHGMEYWEITDSGRKVVLP